MRMRLFHTLLSKRRGEANPRPTGGKGPRGFVGGLWHELGELQFRFLVDRGLRPEHVLLDVACGSLRGGVRFIPYLEPGNYLGIDRDRSLIDHGIENELGRTMFGLKRPEFIVSNAFEFERFSKRPDFALAQSLFTHLDIGAILICLRNLRACTKPRTRFFVTFFETSKSVENPPESHPHASFRYTRSQMETFGSETGWAMRYIGDWAHPRGQRMVEYH
jgi:hypothetical protein